MKKFVKCLNCGKYDNKKYEGTSIAMICPDCNKGLKNAYGSLLAQLCRNCCPTGHGTKGDEDFDAEG